MSSFDFLRVLQKYPKRYGTLWNLKNRFDPEKHSNTGTQRNLSGDSYSHGFWFALHTYFIHSLLGLEDKICLLKLKETKGNVSEWGANTLCP